MKRKTHRPDRMPGYVLPVYEYRAPPEIASKKTPEYPVIVVGAGLGGLAAALELASRGVRTLLLDEDDTVGAAGLSSRGICYAKRSLEILDRFGVARRIRAKGVTWNEGDVFRGKERLYRFNLQPERDQKFPAFVNLQQFYVEQYLVEALEQYPAAEIRWKNRVVDVIRKPSHVEVKVETPDGAYRARCRYLVAADGAHSVVRAKLGAKDVESELYETAWCIADVKMRSREAPVRKAYLDNASNDGGAIWYHQMADGVWRTDWQISHYARPEAEASPARARRRLRRLLGPKARFDLIWVGPWRFRRRCLEKLVHGHVFFLGDAAAQHSPFGARGGNRAIQDANNLGWKLARVLAGEARPALLASYEAERYRAARESVEIASRSALFISPERHGQRLYRDAVLDLARRHAWARALVNVGRLSTACDYYDSPLSGEGGGFDAPLAAPGRTAPDGRLGRGHFVERLQGDFTVAYFGNRGPRLDWPTLYVPRAGHEALFRRYGVPREGATYVFRPDGHVLARARGVAGEFAREAIRAALRGRKRGAAPAPAAPATVHDRDRLYDTFAALYEKTPPRGRERMLATLVVALGSRLDPNEVLETMQAQARPAPPLRLARTSAPAGRRRSA